MLYSLAQKQLLFSKPDINCTYNGVSSDATDLTTYTFAAMSLGLPQSNRLIVAAVHAEDALTTYTVSSVTVTPSGGSAVSLSPGPVQVATPAIKGQLWFGRVPIGWSGDVAVTFDEAITSAAVGLFSVYGVTRYKTHISSAIGQLPVNIYPFATVAVQATDNVVFGNPVTAGPAIMIACGTNAASGDRATMTGVDEKYDQDVGAEIGICGGFRKYLGDTQASCTIDWVTGTSIVGAVALFY